MIRITSIFKAFRSIHFTRLLKKYHGESAINVAIMIELTDIELEVNEIKSFIRPQTETVTQPIWYSL